MADLSSVSPPRVGTLSPSVGDRCIQVWRESKGHKRGVPQGVCELIPEMEASCSLENSFAAGFLFENFLVQAVVPSSYCNSVSPPGAER